LPQSIGATARRYRETHFRHEVRSTGTARSKSSNLCLHVHERAWHCVRVCGASRHSHRRLPRWCMSLRESCRLTIECTVRMVRAYSSCVQLVLGRDRQKRLRGTRACRLRDPALLQCLLLDVVPVLFFPSCCFSFCVVGIGTFTRTSSTVM